MERKGKVGAESIHGLSNGGFAEKLKYELEDYLRVPLGTALQGVMAGTEGRVDEVIDQMLQPVLREVVAQRHGVCS